MIKTIFESRAGGRREVERPRLRLLEDVENDVSQLKVISWREKAKNREKWTSVIKEAEGQ